MEGRIFALESMGLVDGPGIRAVVFLKGCRLRCRFCHNPDSFCGESGEWITEEDLEARILRFRPYFERSGGGVTFSGGEPLLQKEFLTAMLRRMKMAGIHTCIDTAGVGDGDYAELLSLTDLVLYDVKAIDEDGYFRITGQSMEQTERFQAAMRKAGVPAIVRQVVLPGVNDTDEYMEKLALYVKEHIPTAIGVELLPYHKLGVHKYKKYGMEDPLKDVPQMDKHRTNELQKKHFDTFSKE